MLRRVPSDLDTAGEGGPFPYWKGLTLAVFAAWVLLVGYHHEPWFDESQAWLLARDNSLWELIAHCVRYEGSPGLWHVILWLAMRCGLPFSSLFVIPATFAIAGAAVVLWCAPFPPLLRVAILCSYFFGYQYSVVARSYCVDLLLFPLLAACIETRFAHPLRYGCVVGLIANLNAHGFLVAAVLGIEWLCRGAFFRASRNTQCVPGIALALVLGLFALWTAWQPADNNFLPAPGVRSPVSAAINFISQALIDRLTVWQFAPRTRRDTGTGLFISLVALYPFVRLVAGRLHGLLALGIVGILVGFSAFVYASPWHAGLLFLSWIFLLWIGWARVAHRVRLRRQLIFSMTAICLLQAVQTVRTGTWDISHAYSPGRSVAGAIVTFRDTHPAARIVGYGFKSFEVQPWLAANPYANYHGGAAHPSYMIWAKGEGWPVYAEKDSWHEFLSHRADLVVGSSGTLDLWTDTLIPIACGIGYGVRQRFDANLIWRGSLIENETIWLLTPGDTDVGQPHCGDVKSSP